MRTECHPGVSPQLLACCSTSARPKGSWQMGQDTQASGDKAGQAVVGSSPHWEACAGSRSSRKQPVEREGDVHVTDSHWCWDDMGFRLTPSLMVLMAAWEYTVMSLQCQGTSRSDVSQLQNCHHYPHLLLSVPCPPDDSPVRHSPEQMGQTPVSPSPLACPLSFLLTRFSRGPLAWAFLFTLGVLEVAAGAL